MIPEVPMVLAALLVALALPAPQQPPRDRTVTPGIVLDAPAREAELAKRIAGRMQRRKPPC